MAVGTSLVVAGLLGLGGGVAASKIMSGGNKGAAAAPMPLPQSPSPEAAAEKGADNARKKKAAMSNQTIFTSPLGIGGEADLNRKTLLGQ